MNKEFKNTIINVAKSAYDNGHSGEASLRYCAIEPIQTEKVDCLHAQLREQITEAYNKLKQLKKSELNKTFICEFFYLKVRINDTDHYDTRFTVICDGRDFCTIKCVRGRTLKELKPLDEILANIDKLKIEARDLPFKTSEHLIGIERNDDGTYNVHRYNHIYQAPVVCARRNWPRQKMCNSFCKMVLDKANEFINAGYKLTSTAYEKFGITREFLTFKA